MGDFETIITIYIFFPLFYFDLTNKKMDRI